MNKICRTCLCGEGPLFSLHEPPAPGTRDFNLCDMILSLAYVEMHQGDGLPEDICQSCVEKATVAYNFKALCERSDAVLREAGPGGSSKLDASLLDSNLLTTELEMSSSQSQDTDETVANTASTQPSASLPEEAQGTVEVYEVSEEGYLMLVGGRVSCPQTECKRRYSQTFSMRQHLTHTSDRQLLCAVCGKRFKHSAGLRQHARQHSVPSPSQCPSCPRTYPSPAALRAHQRRVHSVTTSPSPCPHCGKTFSSTSSLSSHMKIHSAPTEYRRMFSCPHCQRCYTRPAYLRVHLASAHSDPSQPPLRRFPCPYSPCTRQLPTKLSLQIHIRHKHTLERPYTCTVCSKAFSSRPGLTEHMRTHFGTKRESCSVCGGHFVTKQSLRAHQRLHTGERPYLCSECGEGFVSSSRRWEHYQSKHCQRSHVCPTCGKMFHLRRTLSSHMKLHSKRLPSLPSSSPPAIIRQTSIVPEAGFEIVV